MRGRIYNFKNEKQFWNMVKVCEKLKGMDDTFDFGYSEHLKEIFISGEDKDVIFRRCTWLIHNADYDKTTVYRVEE